MNCARIFAVYAALLGLALALLALSLTSGSIDAGLTELWRAAELEDALAHSLVFGLRLPRAVTGFAAGSALALAGALMQVLLRNPLADPFVMGVSGGAAVAALSAMLIGLSGVGVSLWATVGALGAMVLVFALAHGEGGWTPTRLLLTGVVVAAAASAAVSMLLALGDETRLRGMLFWLMGDLAFASPPGALLAVLAA